MKFIVSFLFSIFLMAPVWAAYNPGTTVCPATDAQGSTQQEKCSNTQGCKWNSIQGCTSCEAGYACTNGSSIQCYNHPNWPANTTGIMHPDGASSCSDWVCNEGYAWNEQQQQCTNNCSGITYPSDSSTYHVTSGCDWACNADHYKDGNTCPACPNGTQTSGTDITGGIEACDYCSSGNLIITTTTRKCGACPANSNYNAGTQKCECIYGALALDNNDGFLTSCTCVSPATLSGGQCGCPTNYATTVTDGVVYCTPCLANQISQGGTCVCGDEYYGNANGCTACPSGTKVARTDNLLPTDSTKANCRAHSDTKFCDANGQKCMKLLQ